MSSIIRWRKAETLPALRSRLAAEGEAQRDAVAGRNIRYDDVELVKAPEVRGQSRIEHRCGHPSNEHLKGGCEHIQLLHELARRLRGRHGPETDAIDRQHVAGLGGSSRLLKK
jgi:hypothetical protein